MEKPWPRGAAHTSVTSVKLTPDWRVRPDHVYVGLPGYGGASEAEGIYGKPWSLVRDPRGWRVAYREYLIKRIQTEPEFRAAVMRLHGRTLVCWCKGKAGVADPDCHGDMLAAMAEYLFHKEFGE